MRRAFKTQVYETGPVLTAASSAAHRPACHRRAPQAAGGRGAVGRPRHGRLVRPIRRLGGASTEPAACPVAARHRGVAHNVPGGVAAVGARVCAVLVACDGLTANVEQTWRSRQRSQSTPAIPAPQARSHRASHSQPRGAARGKRFTDSALFSRRPPAPRSSSRCSNVRRCLRHRRALPRCCAAPMVRTHLRLTTTTTIYCGWSAASPHSSSVRAWVRHSMSSLSLF